jgi:hypothetical protein
MLTARRVGTKRGVNATGSVGVSTIGSRAPAPPRHAAACRLRAPQARRDGSLPAHRRALAGVLGALAEHGSLPGFVEGEFDLAGSLVLQPLLTPSAEEVAASPVALPSGSAAPTYASAGGPLPQFRARSSFPRKTRPEICRGPGQGTPALYRPTVDRTKQRVSHQHDGARRLPAKPGRERNARRGRSSEAAAIFMVNISAVVTEQVNRPSTLAPARPEPSEHHRRRDTATTACAVQASRAETLRRSVCLWTVSRCWTCVRCVGAPEAKPARSIHISVSGALSTASFGGLAVQDRSYRRSIWKRQR